MTMVIKNISASPGLRVKLEKKSQQERSKNKQLGHIASRKALLECLYEWGEMATIEQLQVTNYQYLTQFPQYVCSLSHSFHCGAAVLAKSKQFQSIGVDLEPIHRPVASYAQKYFSSPSDKRLAYNLIQWWCLKEACFKAIYPISALWSPHCPKLLLSNIWIAPGNEGLQFGVEGGASVGHCEVQTVTIDQDFFYQAVAAIPSREELL